MLLASPSPVFRKASEIENPYLAEFNKIGGGCPRWDDLSVYTRRRELVKKYAWAIPSEEALDFIAQHGPLIEVGSGTGYWAWCLYQMGVDILATDRDPPDRAKNHWHEQTDTFVPIRKRSCTVASKHPDRTLLMVWPPYDDPMASDALRSYAGNKVIFVGESSGGCTGDGTFFQMLDDDFREVSYIAIPQWYGIHDYLNYYERK